MIVKYLFDEYKLRKTWVYLEGTGDRKDKHKVIGVEIEDLNCSSKTIGECPDNPDKIEWL